MESFRHYSLPHLIAIGLILLSCFLSVKLVRNKTQAAILRRVLIIGLISKLLWYHLWQILFEGDFAWKKHLPLHISQVSIILMIIALVSQKKSFYQFVYYWALWSSLIALLFPEVPENFPHPEFIEFFVGYLLLLTGISYICFVEKIKMTYKYLCITAGAIALYATIIYPINLSLGTNFLFLAEKPKLPGPMDILPAPPWHVPFLVLIVLLLLHLQYFPYFIARKRKLMRSQSRY